MHDFNCTKANDMNDDLMAERTRGSKRKSARSERKLLVKQAVANLLKADKTVVMIAHTLPIVRNADKILVLDHGRIAESGAHDSLVKTEENMQPCGKRLRR